MLYPAWDDYCQATYLQCSGENDLFRTIHACSSYFLAIMFSLRCSLVVRLIQPDIYQAYLHKNRRQGARRRPELGCFLDAPSQLNQPPFVDTLQFPTTTPSTYHNRHAHQMPTFPRVGCAYMAPASYTRQAYSHDTQQLPKAEGSCRRGPGSHGPRQTT